MKNKVFPFFKQRDKMDCGPTCLKMIANYFGRSLPMQELRDLCQINRRGVNLLGINEAAEKLGFQTLAVELTINQIRMVEMPCILYWQNCHFVVLYKAINKKFLVADPKIGKITLTEKQFASKWVSRPNSDKGVSLLLSPTPDFFHNPNASAKKLDWHSILRYFYPYKRLILQLMFGLIVGTIISSVTPFLTQAIVDVGVNNQDINFVFLILIAQLTLTLASTGTDFIRSWILLHVSSRINISILTDFLIKIMKLPISFFQTRSTGDIMQRMNDQQKIENFFTGTSLNALFSLINLITFSIILLYYDHLIFSVSMVSSVVYVAWILFFLKHRRELNYKQFEYSSGNQTNIVEIIEGMADIKLNNSEKQKRWQWENIQASLFDSKVNDLSLSQYQQAGAIFINQTRNILITFLSVQAVINNHISLGGMVAIQYIVAQVSNPIEQLLSFIRSYQDAKISLERLNEVHELKDEEILQSPVELPRNQNIILKDVSFSYPGAGNEPTLKKINLEIPDGKITAIVGMSGSGKTTLLKMLLRFFEPQTGEIIIGNTKMNQIDHRFWRSQCGVVMQEGFLFNDTIQGNIIMGDEFPNKEKVNHAVRIANIEDLINNLPLGLDTKIGATGNGISQGQRQRLLIARAVYKNPNYIFFDEATNALDSNNELAIMDNLNEFFKGRTVVIVAHRLSTIVNADKIVVIKEGEIIEEGTHSQLISFQKEYYELVKNQLKLEV